jgi:hypothetical protein
MMKVFDHTSSLNRVNATALGVGAGVASSSLNGVTPGPTFLTGVFIPIPVPTEGGTGGAISSSLNTVIFGAVKELRHNPLRLKRAPARFPHLGNVLFHMCFARAEVGEQCYMIILGRGISIGCIDEDLEMGIWCEFGSVGSSRGCGKHIFSTECRVVPRTVCLFVDAKAGVDVMLVVDEGEKERHHPLLKFSMLIFKPVERLSVACDTEVVYLVRFRMST